MRIGILIIGSLLWDRRCEREAWRASHLDIAHAFHVKVPIRYGRRSASRGNTFTMTIHLGGSYGQAVVVPCRIGECDIGALFSEAEALWKAEQPDAPPGKIAASWGCVGLLFRDQPPPADWSASWADGFRARQASHVPPLDGKGFLNIPWPQTVSGGTIDADLILATATRANNKRPTSNEIADAWIDQNGGNERYFFENVRHGIRTPEDSQIWRRIEERAPAWLSLGDYAEAVGILRDEARSHP
jgi:hypothetical protein